MSQVNEHVQPTYSPQAPIPALHASADTLTYPSHTHPRDTHPHGQYTYACTLLQFHMPHASCTGMYVVPTSGFDEGCASHRQEEFELATRAWALFRPLSADPQSVYPSALRSQRVASAQPCLLPCFSLRTHAVLATSHTLHTFGTAGGAKTKAVAQSFKASAAPIS